MPITMTRSLAKITALNVALAALATGLPVQAQMQSLAISKSKAEPERPPLLPEKLVGVGFEQRLGESVPPDLTFTDATGDEVRLSELLGERPVLLAPVYFECPMLCSLVLDGVVRGLKPLRFDPGQELEVVAVSFDPRETPEQAAAARSTVLERYGRPETENGWHFLTGDQTNVGALMEAIGFNYRFDEEIGEYAHAGGIVLLTPEGKASRYLFGVDYAPKVLRLGLVEASANRIGSLIDQVYLYCFRYDATLGKYSAVVVNIVKLACAVTLVAVALFLFAMWRLERHRRLLHPVSHGALAGPDSATSL